MFGIRPDALAGELTVAPGWPAEWTHTKLEHPRAGLAYRREGRIEHYTISPRFAGPMALRLQLPVRGTQASVSVNGQAVAHSIQQDRLVIELPAAATTELALTWSGEPAGGIRPPVGLARPIPVETYPGGPIPPPPDAEFSVVDLTAHFNDRVTKIFKPGKYVSPRSPFVSLAIPAQGIGAWAGHVNATAEIDDTGLRAASAAGGGRITLPTGVPFATPGPGDAPNILFVSQWDNYPREATVPLSGKARRLYLLMAGSTNAMQSRLTNGQVSVEYADNETSDWLPLRNPNNWWPIEQDYFVDDYQFVLLDPNVSPRLASPLPVRVDLKTGTARILDYADFKGRGRVIPGGAATVLEIPLDPGLELKSLTIHALANEVVIGLMAATLVR